MNSAEFATFLNVDASFDFFFEASQNELLPPTGSSGEPKISSSQVKELLAAKIRERYARRGVPVPEVSHTPPSTGRGRSASLRTPQQTPQQTRKRRVSEPVHRSGIQKQPYTSDQPAIFPDSSPEWLLAEGKQFVPSFQRCLAFGTNSSFSQQPVYHFCDVEPSTSTASVITRDALDYDLLLALKDPSLVEKSSLIEEKLESLPPADLYSCFSLTNDLLW